MRRAGAVLTFLFLCALCATNVVFALDRAKNIDQYGHEMWISQNGLPGEAVYQILQTPDGYLWLRTSAGLVRFDGVRFVQMDLLVDGRVLEEPVKAICIGADGDLLVRTTTHTLVYKDRLFSDYLPPAPLPDGEIRVILESKEHELFIGSDDFIYVIRNGVIQMLIRGTGWIDSLAEDDQKKIWAGAAGKIYTYGDQKLTPLTAPPGSLRALVLIPDSHRQMLVGTQDGLYKMDYGSKVLEPMMRGAIQGEVNAILRDHDGNLWIGTSRSGLFRFTDNKISSYSSSMGSISDDKILSIYEDREGSLWVGTANGLDRFRDTKLTTLTVKENLPSNEATMIQQAPDGSIYIFCAGGGMARVKNGAVTQITEKDGMPASYGNGFFASKDGSIWSGIAHSLTRYKDGKFTQYKDNDRFNYYISAINEDDESLIVATSETLALRFKDGKAEPFTFEGHLTPLSQPGNYTFTIYRDRAGTLWFGTVKGLFKFAKGQLPDNAQQRAIDFSVQTISDDEHGSLWLGGRTTGMVRFDLRTGRVTRYQKKDGLFDDTPASILIDQKNNLWMSTRSGIYMASRKDLDDFADGKISTIQAKHYGTPDGMKTSEAFSQGSQGGVRSSDGKLWFTTVKGVVVVDPAHLPHNSLVPPVMVEEVVADGETLPVRQELQLPPGKDKIEIRYTALSFLIPRRLRFKYKLEGYDKQWVDAKTRHVAYYNNLSPGHYRFCVIASNDDGVWNETGASIDFFLKPHFYQTFWFYSLCIAGLVLLAYSGSRLYTRRLRLRAEKLEKHIDQRTADLALMNQALQGEVNERIRAEEALSEERRLLRTLIDNVPDFMYVKDAESRFTLANSFVARSMGTESTDELIGKTDFDFYPRELAQGYYEDEQNVIRSGEALTNREEECVDTQGNWFWLLTTKVPIVDKNGRVTGIIGIGRDLTRRKQIEIEMQKAKEAAEAANRAKSEFLANMSHEIRTPMNGIMGMAELAMTTEGAEQREFLSLVRSSAESLLVILNDILDYSKIEAGKIVLDPVQLNVRDLVSNTVKSLAPTAHKKNLELAFCIEPKVPHEIIADPVRLRQVLLNLTGNAIKFTEKGEVVVTVEVVESHDRTVTLRFSVRDTGIGISPEKQAKLFRPFEQADNSTTRQYGGTGLGLAICSRIAKLMSSEIKIESIVDEGSIFHFTADFAVAVDNMENSLEKSLPSTAKRLCGLSVLIIDDNATSRSILEQMVREWRMLPELADSGPAGIARLQAAAIQGHTLQLILLDEYMTGMNGLEVMEHIRASSEWKNTPLLMLTSASQNSDLARKKELGVNTCLIKPVHSDDLLKAICSILDESQSEKIAPAPSNVVRTLAGIRILVAEDNLVNQKLAISLLTRMGHHVTMVGNGAEAVAKWQEETFDLIFMDIQMPEMDGLSATRKIRWQEQGTGRHIPIIAMTAHAMTGDRERCLDAGMDDHITKPVSLKMLEQAIERHSASMTVVTLS